MNPSAAQPEISQPGIPGAGGVSGIPDLVEYMLFFDRLVDALQARELQGCARTCQETIVFHDGRRCSVIYGTMPQARLLALRACRRNSTCTMSVPASGIYDRVLWYPAGH